MTSQRKGVEWAIRTYVELLFRPLFDDMSSKRGQNAMDSEAKRASLAIFHLDQFDQLYSTSLHSFSMSYFFDEMVLYQ